VQSTAGVKLISAAELQVHPVSIGHTATSSVTHYALLCRAVLSCAWRFQSSAAVSVHVSALRPFSPAWLSVVTWYGTLRDAWHSHTRSPPGRSQPLRSI